ncbi:signal peptidase I [uncultured Leifsonia sp.]|uniref:signal peptidase I n=1 Tax=uncultured Leifsonia sp. TaxID=340359 RepID=UPI0025FB9A3A|nr:signal peptidase I [uncultured Leifsonia sp.]
MTDSSQTVRPRRSARTTGWKALLRDVVIIFVVAVLVSFLIKTFVARSFYIPSGSMENTLQINDRIIVNELQPKVFPLQRGDVVVFKDPGGWLPPAAPSTGNPIQKGIGAVLDFVGLGASDSDQHLVKRLIGLPGDHVTCCNALGQMSVNGVPLKEPYVLLPPGQQAVSGKPFDVTVPAGKIWVMGDNRYNSADSRYHMDDPTKGFVPLSDVVGRAFVISWPVSHWSWLDNYPETFQGTERKDQ